MSVRRGASAIALLKIGIAVVLAAFALVDPAWRAAASADPPQGPPRSAPPPGQQGIVETGTPPDAEKIGSERGIELVGGNGLIEYTECGPTGLLQVRSATNGLLCFTARAWPGTDGFLAVKIPDTYSIKGDGDRHQVKAILTTEAGNKKTYDIRPDEWTPVGQGADPDNGPETLIELRTKAAA
ncbi:hypothetical protein D0T12_22000 [Actinomadura spongiicola]|uniref:Uncharacterized protein n=1 Tax=Actinomadura spongiicola TaxID=2303421 RepID=A0A372GF24_9ACTN|nr:hypothetical protein [Actinomadura spongiicola]RFS83689.1 hypothetical protein D0T12_22000 [Actinomadura spongiicola]